MSTALAAGDPLGWDVEAVVRELCPPATAGPLRGAEKRPDPNALAAALREHEVDGETLLQYGIMFGSYDSLLGDLGIKKSSHKFYFVKAVESLRAMSPGFRRWRKEWTLAQSRQHDMSDTEDVPPSAPNSDAIGGVGADAFPMLNGPAGAVVTMSGVNPPQRPQRNLQPGATTPAASIAARGSQLANPDESSKSLGQSDQSKKKRKVAPLNVSSVPVNAHSHIPTAMDVVVAAKKNPVLRPDRLIRRVPLQASYLGNEGWNPKQLTSENNERSHGDWGDGPSGTFSWVRRRNTPAGRREQVYHEVQRSMISNNAVIASLRGGMAPATTSQPPDSEDELLPLWGESDDEDYDSDTYREIEEELAERENTEAAESGRHLNQTEAGKALDACLRDFADKWDAEKLPVLARKANRLWNENRRSRKRSVELAQAATKVKQLEQRLAKLRDEMLLQQWSGLGELKRQASCMEPSVAEKKYNEWLLELLMSSREPPKPKTQPRRTARVARQRVAADDGGESLTSDSDDGLENFIDEDEMDVDSPPPQPPKPRGMKLAVPSHMKLEDHVEIIDLTMSDPEETPQDMGSPAVIDLVSPPKPPTPVAAPIDQPEHGPDNAISEAAFNYDIPFDRPADIALLGPAIWQARGDAKRLLVWQLHSMQQGDRDALFSSLMLNSPQGIWDRFLLPVFKKPIFSLEADGDLRRLALPILCLFWCYKECKPVEWHWSMSIPENTAKELSSADHDFIKFHRFMCKDLMPVFPRRDYENAPSSNRPPSATNRDNDETESATDEEEVNGASQNSRKKAIVVDKAAQDLRKNDMLRVEEQNRRRLQLREQLKQSESISGDKSRLIINESKQDDQGLVYVSDEIGKRIKDHQIAGIRFMWNQIVVDATHRQGCLLAHTMGMGKTMQVITLLVAIAEAVTSPDPTVGSQIPDDLRVSRTLVLCPAGLVDNWMDELLMWAPEGLLGQFLRIDTSIRDRDQRAAIIKSWEEDGGVLIVGYTLLVELHKHEAMRETLENAPNIVVADEAHQFKNPNAKKHQATAGFRTKARIALTGSPLANNVMEYYYMINWIAPNYLGPTEEFRRKFEEPIHEGLFVESTGAAKRKARKLLRVLSDTVAPRVHRATILELKEDLPPKVEFILTTALTDMQRRLYDWYIESTPQFTTVKGRIFGVINLLGLICNHPKCFLKRLDARLKKREAARVGNSKAAAESTEEKGVMPPDDIIREMLKLRIGKDMDLPEWSGKVPLLVQILDEARQRDDKVLIFSHCIPTLDYLETLLKQQHRRVSRLDGDTATTARSSAAKAFNSKKISEGGQEIYLISTKAGGVGLNIYGANRVVLFDFKFNPVDEQQAVGRAYRLGQQKKVYVYRFISGGSFEEAMHNKAIFKAQLASHVVDKQNLKSGARQLIEFVGKLKEAPISSLSKFEGEDDVLKALIKTYGNRLIYSIVGGDTFEEEEAVHFTEEEAKEIQEMIRIQKLMTTNPSKAVQEWEYLLMNPLTSGHLQPPAMPALDGSADQGGGTMFIAERSSAGKETYSNAPSKLPAQARGSIPTPQQIVLPADSAVTAAWIRDRPATALSSSSLHLRPTLTTSVPLATQAIVGQLQGPIAPMPIVGGNTHMAPGVTTPGRAHAPAESKVPAVNHLTLGQTSGSPHSVPLVRGLEVTPALPQMTATFVNNLRKVMPHIDVTVIPPLDGDPATVASRITLSILNVRSAKALGHLPDKLHWRELGRLISRRRFAMGVISGHLSATFLALTDTTGLNKRAEELDKLPEAEFRSRLVQGSRRSEDPKHLNKVLSRSNAKSETRSMSPRVKEDMKVLRETADTRRRPARLSDFARENLHEDTEGES